MQYRHKWSAPLTGRLHVGRNLSTGAGQDLLGRVVLRGREEETGRMLAELAADGGAVHELEPFRIDRAILQLLNPLKHYMV